MSRALAICPVIVAAAIALFPSPAYPCLNGVLMKGKGATAMLAKAERHLERGENAEAFRALDNKDWARADHLQRALDLMTVVEIRMQVPTDAVKANVEHFEEAAKKRKRDVRVRAWLAEAYAANAQPDAALKILLELKQKDLMPDAFAYLTLARVSSGADRDAALAECRTRAKNAAICALHAKKAPLPGSARDV